MFLRNGTWNYDFVLGGKRYRGSTGFKENEKKKAEREVERIRVEAREGYSVKLTWEQTKRRMLVGKSSPIDDMYKEFHKRDTAKRCAKREQVVIRAINEFVEWLKENRKDVKNISDVTKQDAIDYASYSRHQGGSSYTINNNLRIIKSAFALIGTDCGVIENPFATIKPLPNESENREAFTPEELKMIGENATGWKYSLCITAISTGLREGDICMLRKESVNLESGWIKLKTRKTGTDVEIPILPGLKKHLVESIANSNNEYVYPQLADMYQRKCNISKQMSDFFNSIGIKTQKDVEGYRKKISVKDVHSFRHTFVYLAAIHGVPFPIVQGIVGHASAEMTKHYMDHARREEKAAYMLRLPDYLNGESEENKKTPPSRIATEELEEDRIQLIELVKTIPLSQVRRILDQLM